MSILDYLDKNKEWLFSGGGVVLLGYLATRLAKIFPKKDADKGTVVIVQAPTQQMSHAPSSELLNLRTPAHITKIASVALPEISAALEKAPPLQKEDVAKHYIGLNVQWETYLFNAEKDENDNVHLTLDFGPRDMHLVYCSVRLSEYRELGVLPKGAPISIVGRIKKVERKSATLDEVQLFFHGN